MLAVRNKDGKRDFEMRLATNVLGDICYGNFNIFWYIEYMGSEKGRICPNDIVFFANIVNIDSYNYRYIQF